MKAALFALTSIAIGVQAQMGAPAGLAPSGGSPAGCVATGSGRYEVQNVKSPSKRSLEKRLVDCSNPDALIVQLNNGVLTDAKGRIGEIVANRQFQFDGPPAQAGTIYDAGWSICPNMSLAIGPSTVFYQCLSGKFYNLYDQPVGAECVEIHQQLLQCADSSGSSPVASTSTTAMSTSTTAAPTTMTSSSSTSSVATTSSVSSAPVSQASDGQPQATSASNATVTTSKAPVPTGGATQFVASGAVVAVGAVAALFL